MVFFLKCPTSFYNRYVFLFVIIEHMKFMRNFKLFIVVNPLTLLIRV